LHASLDRVQRILRRLVSAVIYHGHAQLPWRTCSAHRNKSRAQAGRAGCNLRPISLHPFLLVIVQEVVSQEGSCCQCWWPCIFLGHTKWWWPELTLLVEDQVGSSRQSWVIDQLVGLHGSAGYLRAPSRMQELACDQVQKVVGATPRATTSSCRRVELTSDV